MNPKLAVVQMQMTDRREDNIDKATQMIRVAGKKGAHLVLLPELFEYLYWPQVQQEEFFALANPLENHPFIPHFQALARELSVALPLSFFERAGQAYFNSLAMIDAEGEIQGIYRKSHIPDGPGYMEKFYFNPGDTGFRTFSLELEGHKTRVGSAICWDQWFPEAARIMALQGAELLLYPTAIGSEPEAAGSLDTLKMWQRAMIGHAVSNACYLAAANRIGVEHIGGLEQTFYGNSFIADYTGEYLALADRDEETVLITELDLETAKRFRAGMGFFRDRRTELYKALLSLDGKD